MTRIKICGLRTPADIAAANESRPDYIGFILSPGYRRSITKEQALALREQLDPGNVQVGEVRADEAFGGAGLFHFTDQADPRCLQRPLKGKVAFGQRQGTAFYNV